MSRRVLPLRLAALMRFSAIRADLPGPHRRRRSPVSPHVAGTIDGFPPPAHRGNMWRFHLAALPIIRSESEPSRRDKCEGSPPQKGGVPPVLSPFPPFDPVPGFEARHGDRAKKIVELRRAGLSLRQIAVVVGCTHKTVANELRQPLVIKNRFNDLIWVCKKGCYVLVGEPVDPLLF